MILGFAPRWTAAIILCGISCCTFAADRPNLLIIMTDNQSPSLLGTYGNSEIRTPNIDRLAAEGIQFNNAFAVSGVCSPTRATFMTGLLFLSYNGPYLDPKI
jgi:hypothetical protein